MSGKELLAAAWCAAALLAACAAPGPLPEGRQKAAVPAGPGAAVVFQKQVFKLTKTPRQNMEAILEDSLSSGYAVAVKNHSGDKPMETGFTYSMAPKGATYPFSEIEVSCIMQEKYAARIGPRLCGDFFTELDLQLNRRLKRTGK